MRTVILSVSAAAVVACSSSRPPEGFDPNAVTLCIENAAVGYGNVVAYVGSMRFNVYPGEETCKDIRGVGADLPIRATTTGGGSLGPLRFAFRLPASSGCWYWRVSTSAALDVMPCDDEEL